MKSTPIPKGTTRESFVAIKNKTMAQAIKSGCCTAMISDPTSDAIGNKTPLLSIEQAETGWIKASDKQMYPGVKTVVLPASKAKSEGKSDGQGASSMTSPTVVSGRAPTNDELKRYKKNREAMSALLGAAESEGLQLRLGKCETAYKMWRMILDEFESTSTLKDLGPLTERFNEVHPSNYDKFEDYASAIDTANQLSGQIDKGQ
jgi:hypothetical protein